MGVPGHFFLWQRWPSRMHIYCSVGPPECIFMAPLTLFNEAPKRKDIAPLAL